MEENPSKSTNLDLIKFMLEQRTHETTLHIRSYGLMLAINLSAFAAAFAYLSQSDERVPLATRFFIGLFGTFLAFCWWSSTQLDLKRIGFMTSEIQKLVFRSEGIPEELERLVVTRINIEGKAIDHADLDKGIYTMHLPIYGFGVAWAFISMIIGHIDLNA
jgi:hypothetical protein